MDRFGVKPNDERYPNYATKTFLVWCIKRQGNAPNAVKPRVWAFSQLQFHSNRSSLRYSKKKSIDVFVDCTTSAQTGLAFRRIPPWDSSLAEVFPKPVLIGGQTAEKD